MEGFLKVESANTSIYGTYKRVYTYWKIIY